MRSKPGLEQKQAQRLKPQRFRSPLHRPSRLREHGPRQVAALQRARAQTRTTHHEHEGHQYQRSISCLPAHVAIGESACTAGREGSDCCAPACSRVQRTPRSGASPTGSRLPTHMMIKRPAFIPQNAKRSCSLFPCGARFHGPQANQHQPDTQHAVDSEQSRVAVQRRVFRPCV